MRAEILVLSLFLLCGHSMGEQCKALLHSVATTQQFFVGCTTLHAVPVEMCIECKETYDNMLEAYSNITKSKNCSAIYIDSDRLNIISTTQSILTGLWTKAFCEDCFVNNNIGNFIDKYIAFDNCLTKNTNQSNLCKECFSVYKDLNDFYINMDQHNNAKVCYDIQDKMNHTRCTWSKTYKCSHRSFDITVFLIASSFCAALPFLFYMGVFLYGKRRELNHGVLDADAEDNAPLVSAEISPLEKDPIVAPTPILVPTTAKSMNLESDSSDDDSDYRASSPKNKIL